MPGTEPKPNMPIVKSFAAKCGKSEDEVSKLWIKAEEIAAKSRPTKDSQYYQIVVGILKKMCGIKNPPKESYTRLDNALSSLGYEELTSDELEMVDMIISPDSNE